jgi:hypothetical protein
MRNTVLVLAGLAFLAPGCAGSASKPPASAIDPKAASTEARPRLEAHGFSLLDFRVRRDEHDVVYVVGEIKNVGASARGVQLQASLRDREGRLLAVGDFYPASNTNIKPGESWPFAHSFGRQDGNAARAELRIVGVFRALDAPDVAYVKPQPASR